MTVLHYYTWISDNSFSQVYPLELLSIPFIRFPDRMGAILPRIYGALFELRKQFVEGLNFLVAGRVMCLFFGSMDEIHKTTVHYSP